MEKRVEVKIGGAVAASCKSSISQSTDSLGFFSSEIKSLNRTVANVSSYRNLKSEVFSTANAFHEAKRGLRHMKDELDQQRAPLSGFQTKLKEQRSEVKVLNGAYKEKKSSLRSLENQLNKARDSFSHTHKRLEGMQRVSKAATKRYEEQKQTLLQLERAYKKNSESVVEAKSAFDSAKLAAQGTNEKLKAQSLLVKNLDKDFQKTSKTNHALSATYTRQKSELERVASAMKQAGVSTKHLEAEERRLQRALDATNAKMKAASALASTTNRNRSVMQSAPGEIMSTAYAALPVAAPIITAASFEASGSNLEALSNSKNGIAQEMGSLKEMALSLGSDKNIAYNAIEAMGSMKYMAMAGMGAKDIKASVGDVLRLSIAGGTEAGEAADIGTNIMSAYGLEGDNMGAVGDILTKAFTSHNVGLSSLGETMKYVGPLAGMLAKSDSAEDKQGILAKMSAMTGILGDQGIQGSMAGTGLRKIVTSLTSPTTRGAPVLDEMGVITKDSSGNLREIDDILIDINRSMEGLGSADRAESLKKIFGEEALSSATALTKAAGSGELKKAIANVNEYDGVMSRIAAKKMDNVVGSFSAMKSAFVSSSIVVGNSFLPVVKFSLDTITTGVTIVGAFADKFPFLTGAVLTATAGIIGFKIATLNFNLVRAVMSDGIISASRALYFFTGIQLGASKVTGGLTFKSMLLSFANKEIAISSGLATRATALYNLVSKNSLVIGGLAIARTVTKALAMGVLTLAYGNSAAASVVLTGATAALSTVFAACPIGWVVGGIAALVGGVVLAYNKIEWFRSAVDWAWDSLKSFAGTVMEFLSFGLYDKEKGFNIMPTLDTSGVLDEQKKLEQEMTQRNSSGSQKEKTPAPGESMRVNRPLRQAQISENLTGMVIDFEKKSSESKNLMAPVKDKIVSRLPKEIAIAAALSAAPTAAASLPGLVQTPRQVVHQGDVKNEFKFELSIYGADKKQASEITDQMKKFIEEKMAEAERKRKIEEKRSLMDRSKGGAF